MFNKALNLLIIVCFFLSTLAPLPQAHADTLTALPAPGTMVNLSPAYEPAIIRGLTVHKDNPFLFDFIVDAGQDRLSGEPLKKEGQKLIKYFLASLAIPDKDVWVNLSPYEKDKIIPGALGQTDMGRDLLEQDYILKQITASLIYPEKDLGKKFWEKVYAESQHLYGTTQVPVNTFNKVWIVADRAEVFERNQTAFVVDSHLKVMLEEDYLALQKHQRQPVGRRPGDSVASNIIKSIILPELEKEINTGKNFANLRQIFNSIILSSWYKKDLKQALLNQFYADKSKVKGIKPSLQDLSAEQIYEQYLKAYKKGVFNYIKEEVNTTNGQPIPRKYFAGGINEAMAANPTITDSPRVLDAAMGFSYEDRDRLFNLMTVFNATPQSSAGAVTVDDQIVASLEKNRSVMFIGGRDLEGVKIYLLNKHPFPLTVMHFFNLKKANEILGPYHDHLGLIVIGDQSSGLNNLPDKEIGLFISDLQVRFPNLPVILVSPHPGLSDPPNVKRVWRENLTPFLDDIILKTRRNAAMITDADLSFNQPRTAVEIAQKGLDEDVRRYKFIKLVNSSDESELQALHRLVASRAQALASLGMPLSQDIRAVVGPSMRILPPVSEVSYTMEDDTIVAITIKPAGPQAPIQLGKEEDVFSPWEKYINDHEISPLELVKLIVVINGWSIIGTRFIENKAMTSSTKLSIRGKLKSESPFVTLIKLREKVQKKKIILPDAIAKSPLRGGIDLNTSSGMQWKLSKEGNGVEMNIDPAMMARFRREGIDNLSPVILKITPVTSIWPLVGLEAPIPVEYLAKI